MGTFETTIAISPKPCRFELDFLQQNTLFYVLNNIWKVQRFLFFFVRTFPDWHGVRQACSRRFGSSNYLSLSRDVLCSWPSAGRRAGGCAEWSRVLCLLPTKWWWRFLWGLLLPSNIWKISTIQKLDHFLKVIENSEDILYEKSMCFVNLTRN